MSKLIVGALPDKKEKKVHKIEDAFILDRGSRKHWIVRYKVLFEDGTVKEKEASTKVGKSEKTLKYMQTRFLHGWIAKKEKELSTTVKSNKLFSYYASMFINECKELEDAYAIELKVNRIVADFGHLEIKKITKTKIKQWIINLTDKRTGKLLGKNSRGKYLGVFRGVFRLAVEDDELERNIVNDIEFNKKSEKRDLEEIRPFNPEEVSCLLQRAKSGHYGKHMYGYLSIGFFQGMSPSETLALQVDDIDFEESTISVKRDLSKGKLKATKNDYREREIPIFDVAIPILKSLAQNAKEKQTPWLFSNDDGSHLYDISSIRGSKEMIQNGKPRRKDTGWYKLINDCKIDYRHIKNTRHTFAVRMIELSSRLDNEITYQGIADMLGHGSLKMLNEHYAKWIKGKSKKIRRSLNIYESENSLGDTLGDSSKNSDFSSFKESA